MTEETLNEIERLWRDGVPLKDIADAVGYTKQYVALTVCKDRKRFPYRREKTPIHTREKWVARINAGRITKAETAKLLGMHYQTIDRWVREIGGKQ